MGDHYSSPRVLDDPAADIADVFVFPSPERPGHVVLVLTVFPSAAVTPLLRRCSPTRSPTASASGR